MTKARILVVEDETIIAMEIKNQLQNLGYEVTSVVNTGDKAIHKAEEDNPDLILMDIRIQGDKDGIETAEAIRNKFGIPVVFSTAYLDEERIERAKITMPFGYVLKPIQERDLRVTLEMALYVAEVDSERKTAEASLRNSEEMYRALFEKNLNPIAIINSDGKYLEANDVFLGFVKKSRNELLNMNVFDFAPPAVKEEQEIQHRPAWKTGCTLKTDYDIEGNIKTLELMVSPVMFMGQDAVIGIGTDITEHKNAEKALLEAQKELNITLDATTDGIWKWDLKTDELWFSDQYYKMLGYEPGAFPATFESWINLIHPEDKEKALETANEYLKTKPDVYENEFRLKSKTGNYRWVKAKAKVVEWNESGNAVRMIGNHRRCYRQKKPGDGIIP